MGYNKIYLEIEAESDEDSYYGSDVNLTYKQVSLSDIANNYPSELNRCGFHKIEVTNGGTFTKATEAILKQHGWIHKETAKTREDKKLVSEEYYMLDMDSYKNKPYIYNPSIEVVDLDNLSEKQISNLASGKYKIAQIVTNKSVLPDSVYKKVQDKKKKNQEEAAKRAATKKKKEQSKKQKEIEAAKKLLQENGESL